MSEQLTQPWSDREHAAYELGMYTEREHQNANARIVMRQQEAALTAAQDEARGVAEQLRDAQARILELEQQLAELKSGKPLAAQAWVTRVATLEQANAELRRELSDCQRTATAR